MALRQHEPALLLAALDAAGEAVVLCSRADDTILLVNPAAAALLPGGRAPVALDFFNTEHDGRFRNGRRRQLGPDHYGWFLRDDTDEMTPELATQWGWGEPVAVGPGWTLLATCSLARSFVGRR